MATTFVTVDRVTQAISNEFSSELRRAIHKKLMEQIEPMVRSVAEETAKAVLCRVEAWQDSILMGQSLGLQIRLDDNLLTKVKDRWLKS